MNVGIYHTNTPWEPLALSDSITQQLARGSRVFLGVYDVDSDLEESLIKEASSILAGMATLPPVIMLQTALKHSHESEMLARFLQSAEGEVALLGDPGEHFRFEDLERNSLLWRNLLRREDRATISFGVALDAGKSAIRLPGGEYIPACCTIDGQPNRVVSYSLVALTPGIRSVSESEKSNSEFICVKNNHDLRASLGLPDYPIYAGDYLIIPRA